MNLDELRTVQTKERQKDSLQHLRDSFYEDVAEYITDLKAERTQAADAADDPFSDPEVSRLTDEIETAEEVVEAVYERRVGKVVKLSSFAAADMPVDEEGLTTQERDLFEDLVGRIGENKERVLAILAGERDSGPASPPAGGDPVGAGPTDEPPEPTHDAPEQREPADTDAGPATEESPSRSEPAVGMGVDDSPADPDAGSQDPPAPADLPPSNDADEVIGGATEAADAPAPHADAEPTTPRADPPEEALAAGPGGASEPAEEADESPDAERTTVRITADVGTVLGVDDREYDLKSEDVVDLPSDNASALLQRDAAEKLE